MERRVGVRGAAGVGTGPPGVDTAFGASRVGYWRAGGGAGVAMTVVMGLVSSGAMVVTAVLVTMVV